jgi:hypothetical protein
MRCTEKKRLWVAIDTEFVNLHRPADTLPVTGFVRAFQSALALLSQSWSHWEQLLGEPEEAQSRRTSERKKKGRRAKRKTEKRIDENEKEKRRKEKGAVKHSIRNGRSGPKPESIEPMRRTQTSERELGTSPKLVWEA